MKEVKQSLCPICGKVHEEIIKNVEEKYDIISITTTCFYCPNDDEYYEDENLFNENMKKFRESVKAMKEI